MARLVDVLTAEEKELEKRVAKTTSQLHNLNGLVDSHKDELAGLRTQIEQLGMVRDKALETFDARKARQAYTVMKPEGLCVELWYVQGKRTYYVRMRHDEVAKIIFETGNSLEAEQMCERISDLLRQSGYGQYVCQGLNGIGRIQA